MKYLLVLFFSFLSLNTSAEQLVKCSYGYVGVPIFELEFIQYSEEQFSDEVQITNAGRTWNEVLKPMPAKTGELHHFSVGQDGIQLIIYPLESNLLMEALKSKLINPNVPKPGDEMLGECLNSLRIF